MNSQSARAGRHVRQSTGYRAFIPAPLPPDPPLRFDSGLVDLLSKADRAIGRLDGASRVVSNADLFVTMYIRREAVLSSRIEGTRSSLDDVLAHEIDPARSSTSQDVEEVANYVRAMNYGLARLETLPLSLRFIREIHAELMRGSRFQDKRPGEFRTSQNWIGAPGALLAEAAFVPPPPVEMRQSLDNFERFLHDPGDLPALVYCGIAHAQFEMIHPFLDGNGRVGRLLITLLLRHRGVLHLPLLYLSQFLNDHRSEYYDRLTRVHDSGDWEGWIAFFLRGVLLTAEEATRVVRATLDLRSDHLALVRAQSASVNAPRLLDLLFRQPILDATVARDELGVSFQTASTLIQQFQTLGLLEEITGRRRQRKFRYTPYVRLFEERGAGAP